MTGEAIKLGESQSLRIVASTPDALELESTWAPGGKPPPRHYHPHQDERFEVLSGELTVEVGSDPPRVLNPGDILEVPRGVAHLMWNAGAEPTQARWRITPALRTEEMFRFMSNGLSPQRIPAVLWTFRNEYRLALRR